MLSQTVRAATQFAANRIITAGAVTAQTILLDRRSHPSDGHDKVEDHDARMSTRGDHGALDAGPPSRCARIASEARTTVAPGTSTRRIAPNNPDTAGANRLGSLRQNPAPSESYSNNGLTVLLRPIRDTKSIALTVLYSIGSDHDPAGHSGLTHMLEHLYITAAAGQEKTRTAEEFARRYAMGANGQTGHRYTVFAAVFPTNELDAELKDAAARMGDLRITPADLERERPRMIEEVSNMFGGIPMLAALNNARELARPTPAGGRDGGSPAHLRALTQQELLNFWKRYYKPCNAILSLAGDIDSTKVRKAIETYFARIPSGEKPSAPPPLEKPKLGISAS